MNYQRETQDALETLYQRGPDTVAYHAMLRGARENEPLLVAMDAMIRYAKAYRTAQDSPVGDDGVLGPHFAAIIAGLRGLLNGDGAAAMETGITTDSKDNGTLEDLYWKACELAGLNGDNI